ncbi:MAG: hypothetical protein ACLP50_10325 [Solirubrobacteraceae bacterium]
MDTLELGPRRRRRNSTLPAQPVQPTGRLERPVDRRHPPGLIRVLGQKLARIVLVKRRVLKQQAAADHTSPTMKCAQHPDLSSLDLDAHATRAAPRRHP